MGFKKTATKQNKIKKEGRGPILRTATGQMWGGHRTDLAYITVNKKRANKGMESDGHLLRKKEIDICRGFCEWKITEIIGTDGLR